jgi:hypothetical protein
VQGLRTGKEAGLCVRPGVRERADMVCGPSGTITLLVWKLKAHAIKV